MAISAFYEPFKRALINQEHTDYDHDFISQLACVMTDDYQDNPDNYPSRVWVIFGGTSKLRVFFLDGFPPPDIFQRYLNDIERLVKSHSNS